MPQAVSQEWFCFQLVWPAGSCQFGSMICGSFMQPFAHAKHRVKSHLFLPFCSFGFLGFLLSFAEHRRNISQGDSKSGQAVPHFERSLPTLEGHEFCAPVMLAPQLHVGLLGKLQDWARACLLASGFWVAACLFKGLAHRIHL